MPKHQTGPDQRYRRGSPGRLHPPPSATRRRVVTVGFDSADQPGRARALLSWSSGKDSAWALHTVRQRDDLEVVGLLTTFNSEFDRVSMQGVRRELVDAQAQRVGHHNRRYPPYAPQPGRWLTPRREELDRLLAGGVDEGAHLISEVVATCTRLVIQSLLEAEQADFLEGSGPLSAPPG